MVGEIPEMDYEMGSEEEEEEEEIEEDEKTTTATNTRSEAGSGLTGGVFSFFKGLAGQKTLTHEQVAPVLDKMKDHLICEFQFKICIHFVMEKMYFNKSILVFQLKMLLLTYLINSVNLLLPSLKEKS